jgi:hypothetical protein
MTDSIKKVQSLVGATADGVIGVKTLAAICTKLGISKATAKINTIKNIQKHLGATTDGIIGPKTLEAILKALTTTTTTATNDPLIQKYIDKEVKFTPVKYKAATLKQSFIRNNNTIFGKAGDESYLVSVKVPENYPLKYAGIRVKSIRVHRLVADRLEAALKDIINHYGEDIEKVAPGACIYDGSYYYRKTRSGSSQSIHSWGLALDFDAANNALKTKAPAARFSQPIYKPFLDILEHHGWLSLGRRQNGDWMHFQATLW